MFSVWGRVPFRAQCIAFCMRKVMLPACGDFSYLLPKRNETQTVEGRDAEVQRAGAERQCHLSRKQSAGYNQSL